MQTERSEREERSGGIGRERSRPGTARALALTDTHTSNVDDERPPICATCGVTMVPASLSAVEESVGDWICLECEETSEPD
jgi:hypothetical protein